MNPLIISKWYEKSTFQALTIFLSIFGVFRRSDIISLRVPLEHLKQIYNHQLQRMVIS